MIRVPFWVLVTFSGNLEQKKEKMVPLCYQGFGVLRLRDAFGLKGSDEGTYPGSGNLWVLDPCHESKTVEGFGVLGFERFKAF